MERANDSKVILAGFIATLVMTILAYAAPKAGMPKMDFAAMLGSVVNDRRTAPQMSGAWWFGMVWHFVNGSIVFALACAYLVYHALPGSPWLRGAILGTILWLLSQALVMPMIGQEFCSADIYYRTKMVLGSLVGHFVYGAILGAVAGPQAERLLQPRRVTIGWLQPSRAQEEREEERELFTGKYGG